jgi:hypothetical protein
LLGLDKILGEGFAEVSPTSASDYAKPPRECAPVIGCRGRNRNQAVDKLVGNGSVRVNPKRGSPK